MGKKKKKSKNNKNQGAMSPGSNGSWDWVAMGPPPYVANSYVRKKFRYQLSYVPSAGNVQYTFTPSKFAFLQLIASTTVVGVSLYEAARIRRINLFSTPPTDGSVITIGAAFNGASLGIQGDDQTHSAQTFTTARGAHVCLKPNRTDQAGQWQNCTTSATALWFTIYVNSTSAGSATPVVITLDLSVDLRMTTDSRTTGNTISLVTATATDMYYMALDNAASGGSTSNLWKPDRALNTTV